MESAIRQPREPQTQTAASSALQTHTEKAAGSRMELQRTAITALAQSPRQTTQRQILQRLSKEEEQPVQPQQTEAPDTTGLPQNLRSGIETLSGMSLQDVRVHYNSDKPSQLQALAYAQGTDIHVGPGQESHLPHEAWHVVQQKQGKVRATWQMKGAPINDDPALEREADQMGARALQLKLHLSPSKLTSSPLPTQASPSMPIQQVAITRHMHALINEASTPEELEYLLSQTSYSEEVKAELRKIRAGKDPEYAPEDDAEEQEDASTELSLNVLGHQGSVYDEGIESALSYQTAAAVQLARVPGTMSGPKDFASTNFGGFQDAFYILDGKGSVDFSTQPTQGIHAAYKPIGGRKKAKLKHASIVWKDPHKDHVVVNLANHPNIAKLDKSDRPQHFGMADALYAKSQGLKNAAAVAAIRKGAWTWHHLTGKYQMVLIDMEAHAQIGHNGGVYIW